VQTAFEFWLSAAAAGAVVLFKFDNGGRDDIKGCLPSLDDDAVDIHLRRRFHSSFSILFSILVMNA